MKSTHTFGIQFVLRPNRNDRSTGQIYARITVENTRIEISLKKTVSMDLWNEAKGKTKGSSQDVKSFNSYMEQVRGRLTECYRELQLNHEIITAEVIKAMFLGDNPNGHTLMELINYHNSTQSGVLSNGTLKNYRTTKKYVELFLKEKLKTSDIYLSKMNFKFVTEFDFYLRTVKQKDHHQPLNNNGLMKHMQRLKKILNLGVRLEWFDKNPLDLFEIKFIKVERGFLNEYELDIIEKRRFKIKRLELVKDIFIFSCYTGLAYIDAIKLTPSDISVGIDGQKWIFSKREKTRTSLKIPILPKAMELIEKYQNTPRSIHNGTIFPSISNQKMNSYLKEIGDLCGIEKNLTFHLARHTFATTVTLSNGVPIETVSKLLGHRSISTTQIYAKVLENKVSNDMAKLKSKLSGGSPELKKNITG